MLQRSCKFLHLCVAIDQAVISFILQCMKCGAQYSALMDFSSTFYICTYLSCLFLCLVFKLDGEGETQGGPALVVAVWLTDLILISEVSSCGTQWLKHADHGA